MGTPTEENWPGHTKLPDFVSFKPYPATPLREIFIAAGADLITLMETMLALDPNRRCSSQQALKSEYFANRPYPSHGSQLPLPAGIRESEEGAAMGNRGIKRKRPGLAESGLAKRLVF